MSPSNFAAYLVTALLVASSSLSNTSHQSKKYEVLIERTESGQGALVLMVDGAERLRTPSMEHPAQCIDPKVYTGCSATMLSKAKKPGIYIPHEQAGRKGIFIRGGNEAPKAGGAILIKPALMKKLHGMISPKDGRNVTVRIRSVSVTKSLEATRAFIRQARAELDSADKGEANSAQSRLTFLENLLWLQELAEDEGISEELVTKDPLLQKIVEKGTGAAIKFGVKKVIKKILEKIGKKGLGGPAGIVVDVLTPSKIARDPDEVFFDMKSGEVELAQAISSTMAIPRDKRNEKFLKRSYMLMLRRLGYEVKIPK